MPDAGAAINQTTTEFAGEHGRPVPVLMVDAGPQTPVLLYLHGKGEAGWDDGDLHKVQLHQSPPFQALHGRLPGTTVIAPQAPPLPSLDDWNWRGHLPGLMAFLGTHFHGRTLLATGFSRGGLGVLQLLAAGLAPARWAALDPQPTGDATERAALLAAAGNNSGTGWLRFGRWRNRSAGWTSFSSALGEALGDAYDVCELDHAELAVAAFNNERIPATSRAPTLYTHFDL